MKQSPIFVVMVSLASLTWTTGCGGGDQSAAPKQPDEIKKQYIDRAEREQKDNAQNK